MTTDPDALSRDLVYHLLSSPRRRYVIYYLRTTGGPVELSELADQVAAWQHGPPDGCSDRQRKSVYVSLYQTHVPELADAGLIEYDDEAGVVRGTDRLYDVDPYLGRDASDVPWERVYVALAVVGVLTVAVALGLRGSLAGPALVALEVLTPLLFGATAVAHYYYESRRFDGVPAELSS